MIRVGVFELRVYARVRVRTIIRTMEINDKIRKEQLRREMQMAFGREVTEEELEKQFKIVKHYENTEI